MSLHPHSSTHLQASISSPMKYYSDAWIMHLHPPKFTSLITLTFEFKHPPPMLVVSIVSLLVCQLPRTSKSAILAALLPHHNSHSHPYQDPASVFLHQCKLPNHSLGVKWLTLCPRVTWQTGMFLLISRWILGCSFKMWVPLIIITTRELH